MFCHERALVGGCGCDPHKYSQLHTLTMSPKRLLTSRYMSSTPSHLSQMPMLLHCTIKLEYWPPLRALKNQPRGKQRAT